MPLKRNGAARDESDEDYTAGSDTGEQQQQQRHQFHEREEDEDEVRRGVALENGLKFVLLSSGAPEDDDDDSSVRVAPASKAARGAKTSAKGTANSRKERSTAELSGGQMALLGLSFVFACALNRRSPLYLLDEVDAALDESNQRTIGSIINKMFDAEVADMTSGTMETMGVSRSTARNGSQVICVSHHAGFQSQAKNVIRVTMRDGQSIISTEY
jgi:ABC-type polar amino acid transport system ATPase subunit